MHKEKLTWRIEKRKVADLKAADYNPRKMSESEERDLGASIEEFGAVIPIVVNVGKRENVLIGGHQRTKLYTEKKVEEVDVMVPSRELTPAEEKRLNLRLNKNTGSWDVEKLKDMGIELLLDVGFGDEEMQVFFDDVDMIDDDFPRKGGMKEIKMTKTKPGQVYQLGEHRLMCGDSMDPEQVKKLMGGELADVIYCDPPYNIGLNYQKGTNIGGNERANKKGTTETIKRSYDRGGVVFKNDKKKDAEYAAFIDASLKNAIENAKPNFHAFYWCDQRYIWLLQILFEQNKIENKRVCMWIKNNVSPTPQVAFNKAYEPCVYGTMGAPYLNTSFKALNEVLNKEVENGNQMHEDIMEIINLWPVRRDANGTYNHPTQKPVTLAEKPLKRTSSPGHIILDLFGGSGSTMIACEQIKRKAYLMEIDPSYCDIIVKRWEEFTNKKAKRI